MAGGCVGYRCVAVAKIQLGEEIGRESIYIYISLFCSRETRCLFCLCYKLDFLFKNLFITYFLSKIFIKYYINLIKPIQLKKRKSLSPCFCPIFMCFDLDNYSTIIFFFVIIFKLVFKKLI